MEFLTMHFLFNLSLLIVLLFLCFFIYQKLKNEISLKRLALFYFLSSVILCSLFSYRFSEEVILDLRIIPFLIGGLYLRLSPILGLAIILTRGIFGIDFGFYIGAIFYSLFSFFIWKISPWFIKLTAKKRILFLISITYIVSISIIVTIDIRESPQQLFDLWFAYNFIPPLGVAMIAYIVVTIYKNTYLSKQLEKAEKLEAVEQMGAAISHEIRNPLTAAIGFIQLLEEDSLNRKQRDYYLEIIKGELESAEEVIKDYLTFSKPTIDSIEKININKELNHIINLMQPLANAKSVQICTQFFANSFIEGNRQKFHECFINIIRNGLESMPKGGDLLIETISNESNIAINIQDSGIGMSKEQLNRLGEPYYSTKGTMGTGLGIMVAYSIIRAMKGRVKVKSEVNKGTTFSVSFKMHYPLITNHKKQ